MAAKQGDENIGRIMAAQAPALIRELCADTRARGRPLGSVNHDPAEYQTEIVTRLCAGESLQMICVDDTMPSLRTVNRWLASDDDFADAVEGARAIGVNALMDACLSVAGGGTHSTGSVERDKLLVGVIRWIVAKRDPDNSPHALKAAQFFVAVSPDDGEW